MPRTRATPSKGTSTPKGSLGERQISEVAARRRVEPIIKRFEALVAAGHALPAALKVLYTPYLRDLPKLDSLERVLKLGTGASPAPEGRRPDPDDATLERATEASLIAAEDAEDARLIRDSLAGRVDRLTAARAPSPYIEALSRSLVRARLDCVAARRRREVARNVERRAYGAPAARRWADNVSRHRESEEGRSRFPRWWETLRTKKPAHGAPMGLSVRFKEMGASGQLYALGGAAYSFNGRALAFSLNLSAEVDAMAKRQANPDGWLRNRLKVALEAEKLPAHIALVLEVHASGLLHAHGFLGGLGLSDASLITAAARRAGGDYRGRGVQLRLKAQPDTGWASYGAKGLAKALPGMKDTRRIAYTESMRKAAEAFWSEVVTFIADPGEKSEEPAEGKSKLTYNIDDEKKVNFPIKAPCVPILIIVTLLCGRQMEVSKCVGKRLLLTRSRTCPRRWKLGRVPILDSS